VLDAQIISPHLMQFGAYEVLHEEYLELIAPLLKINNVRFD
jgi:Leu/Phe-tRNA-protein transferase